MPQPPRSAGRGLLVPSCRSGPLPQCRSRHFTYRRLSASRIWHSRVDHNPPTDGFFPCGFGTKRQIPVRTGQSPKPAFRITAGAIRGPCRAPEPGRARRWLCGGALAKAIRGRRSPASKNAGGALRPGYTAGSVTVLPDAVKISVVPLPPDFAGMTLQNKTAICHLAPTTKATSRERVFSKSAAPSHAVAYGCAQLLMLLYEPS